MQVCACISANLLIGIRYDGMFCGKSCGNVKLSVCMYVCLWFGVEVIVFAVVLAFMP